jgi:stage III sporulation protein AH
MDTQLEMKKQPRAAATGASRRAVVIACAVLLIAAAVVLNLVLFNGKDNTVDPNVPSDGTVNEGEGNGDTTVVEGDGYFSATQVSRQRARDEALEVLNAVVENDQASAEVKAEALAEIQTIAKEMSQESNIESILMSKGFAQCIAVINGDTANIVVQSEGQLQTSQLAQINAVVYEQAGIEPLNITIVAKG